MNQNVIAEIMAKEGPIVETVILRSNGKVEQVTIDMTSSKNGLVKAMGGELTIIGQFSVLDAVMLKLADDEDEEEEEKPAAAGKGGKKKNQPPPAKKQALAVNKHKLPHPFHDEEHLGDILLMRMDEESEPLSLTSKDWAEFLKTAPFSEEAYAQWKETHKLEEEDEEDGEEEVEFTEEEEAVVEKLLAQLSKKLKREPTQDELIEALAKSGNTSLAEKITLASGDDSDDDEEDEDEVEFTPEEQAALEQAMAQLVKQLKREPSQEEVVAALAKSGNEELAEKIASMEGADSDDDDDEDDDEEEDLSAEEAAALDKTMAELAKKLKREPSQEEIVDALAKSGHNELADKIASAAIEGSSDSEDENLSPEEEAALEKAMGQLVKQLKREPSQEEVVAALAKSGNKELAAKIASMEDDEDSEEDDDADLFTPEEDAIIERCAKFLAKKLRREATKAEIIASLTTGGNKAIADKLAALPGDGAEEEDEDSEEEEDFTEEEEAIVNKTISQLAKKLKHEPTQEDIVEALSKSGNKELAAKLAKFVPGAGDDDDEEEEEEEDEDFADQIFIKLQKELKRDPTDEEMLDALSTAMPDSTSDLTDEEAEFFSNFLEQLASKLKREPEEDEVFAALEKLGKHELIAKLKAEGGEGEDDSEDDEDSLTPEESALLEKTFVALSKKLKREAEQDEVVQALAASRDPIAQSLLEKLMSGDGSDGEDDDDEDSEEEEEEEEVKKPVAKPNSKPPQKQQQQQQKKPQQQQQKKPQQEQKKPQQQQQKRGPPPSNNKHQAKRVKRS